MILTTPAGEPPRQVPAPPVDPIEIEVEVQVPVFPLTVTLGFPDSVNKVYTLP